MIPVINLCMGSGNGVNTACLATACAMIAGVGEQTDHPDCLCKVIAAFVRLTNDAMPGALRCQLYGDLPWQIIGTRTDSVAVMVGRAKIAAKWARKWANDCARSYPLEKYVTECSVSAQSLEDFDTVNSARRAASAAIHAAHAADEASLKPSIKYAISGDCIIRATDQDPVWRDCRACILEMAAFGSRTPIEPVLNAEQLASALCR